VPPVSYSFMAHLDAAFVQQSFHIAKGQREIDIQHHRQTDILATRFEIAKWIRFGHLQTLEIYSTRLKSVSSDSTWQSAHGVGKSAPMRGLMNLGPPSVITMFSSCTRILLPTEIPGSNVSTIPGSSTV
jgi:hypothetical protein